MPKSQQPKSRRRQKSQSSRNGNAPTGNGNAASLLLAELERLRKAYVNTTEVIIQRPQERDGSHPPDADSTE